MCEIPEGFCVERPPASKLHPLGSGLDIKPSPNAAKSAAPIVPQDVFPRRGNILVSSPKTTPRAVPKLRYMQR